jgi:hypothetical protein
VRETIGLSGALDVIGMIMPEECKLVADKIDDGTTVVAGGMVCDFV